MIPILITSNRTKAGKVFFTIGLGQKLMQQGYEIGYIKPLGTVPMEKWIQVEVECAFDPHARHAVHAVSPLPKYPELHAHVETSVVELDGQKFVRNAFEGHVRHTVHAASPVP